MKKTKLSVYRYHDYHRFFSDWMKANQLSLRQFSKQLKISPAYLSQVLSGKKEFSTKLMQSFKKIFKLDKHEMKHLAELLSLARSESHHQKIQVYNKIIKEKEYLKSNPDELEAYSYLSHWYFVALKEYFSLNPTLNQFSEIRNDFIFKLKNSEIKKALLFLSKEKFIEIDQKTSKIKILKDQVDCYADIFRLSLSQFHAQMFGLAIESINLVAREERLILGNSVSLSEKSFEKVKVMIKKLHDDIRELELTETEKERVYHIGLAAFPMTKKKKRGNG